MTTVLYFQNLAWLTPDNNREAWRLANSMSIPGKYRMSMETWNFKMDSFWGYNREVAA